jgi:hypothetical protein
MIDRLILLSTQPFCRGFALQSACSGPRTANCISLVYKDSVRLSSLVHVSGNLWNIGFLVRNENVSVIYKIRCKRTKDSVYVSPICDEVTHFVTNAVIGCILQSGNNVGRWFPPVDLRQSWVPTVFWEITWTGRRRMKQVIMWQVFYYLLLRAEACVVTVTCCKQDLGRGDKNAVHLNFRMFFPVSWPAFKTNHVCRWFPSAPLKLQPYKDPLISLSRVLTTMASKKILLLAAALMIVLLLSGKCPWRRFLNPLKTKLV